MSVTHTHQTAIADDGSDVGANVWNADHTIAAPLTVPGTANTSSLVGTGYSLTGSNAQAMQSWAGTLNTSGVVDVVKVAITDTAHGAGSNLLNLLAGASGTTSMFKVDLSGNATLGGSSVSSSGSFLNINAGTAILLNKPTYIGGTSNANSGMSASTTGFNITAAGRVAWAPSTDVDTVPDTGLSRVAAGIVGVGTGAASSVAGQLQAATVRTISTTVASLPAAATAGAGARSFVTDATQTMTAGIGAAVVGGGANKVPVYCDGTGWFIG